MHAGRQNRDRRGAALVETLVGLFVLIPVVLFLVDIIAIVLAQSQHDQLAKSCARAAAEERSMSRGRQAAQDVADRFGSPFLTFNSLTTTYPSQDTVRCETNVTFRFPVQVPLLGVSEQTFVAEGIEPIVGVAPGDNLAP